MCKPLKLLYLVGTGDLLINSYLQQKTDKPLNMATLKEVELDNLLELDNPIEEARVLVCQNL